MTEDVKHSQALLWMPSTSVSSQSSLLFLEAFYGCRQHRSLPSLHCCFWKPSMDAINIGLFPVFTAVSGSPSMDAVNIGLFPVFTAVSGSPSMDAINISLFPVFTAISGSLLWMPSTSVSSQSSLLYLEAFYGCHQQRSLPSLHCCFWKPSMDAINNGLIPVFTAVSGSLLWMPSTTVSSQSSLLYLEAFYGCRQHRSLPSLHCCFWKPSMDAINIGLFPVFTGVSGSPSMDAVNISLFPVFTAVSGSPSMDAVNIGLFPVFTAVSGSPSMDAVNISLFPVLLLFLEAFYGCRQHQSLPISGSPSMDAVNISLFPVFTAVSGSLLWMPSTSVSSQSLLLFLEAFYGCRQHRSLPSLHCCFWKPSMDAVNIGLFPVFTAVSGSPSMDAVNIGLFPVFTAVSGSLLWMPSTSVSSQSSLLFLEALLWMPSTSVSSQSSLLYLEAFYGCRQHQSLPSLHCYIWKPSMDAVNIGLFPVFTAVSGSLLWMPSTSVSSQSSLLFLEAFYGCRQQRSLPSLYCCIWKPFYGCRQHRSLPSLHCCFWKPSMDAINIGLFPVFTAVSGSLLWMPSTSVSSQSSLLFLEAFYGCRQHRSLPSLYCCIWKPFYGCRQHRSLPSLHCYIWKPFYGCRQHRSLPSLYCCFWKPSMDAVNIGLFPVFTAVSGSLLWMPSTSVSSQSSLLYLEAFYGCRQHRSLPSLYCCIWKPSMDAVNIGLFPVFTAVSGSLLWMPSTSVSSQSLLLYLEALLWMPSTSVSSQSSLLYLEAFYGCRQHRSLPSLHCCFWKPFYGCRQHRSLPSLHCCIWKPSMDTVNISLFPVFTAVSGSLLWMPSTSVSSQSLLLFLEAFYGCRQHRSLPSLHCCFWKPSMDAVNIGLFPVFTAVSGSLLWMPSTSVSSQSSLLFLEAFYGCHQQRSLPSLHAVSGSLLWMPSTSVSSQSSLLYLEAFYGCRQHRSLPSLHCCFWKPSMDAVNIGLFPVFTAVSGSLLWMPSTSVSSQSSLLFLEAFYGCRQHRSLPSLHCCFWKPSMDAVNIGLFPVFTAVSGSLLWMPSTSVSSQSSLLYLEAFYGCRQHRSLPSLHCCIWKPFYGCCQHRSLPSLSLLFLEAFYGCRQHQSLPSLHCCIWKPFYGCRQHRSLPSLHCCFWKPSMDAVNISLFPVFTAVSGSPSMDAVNIGLFPVFTAVSGSLLWMPSTSVSSQSSLLFLEALLWMPSTSVSSQSSLLYLEAFYGCRQHRSLPSLHCCFWKPSMDAVNNGLFPVFTAVSGSLLWMPSTTVSSQSSLLFLEAFYGCHQQRSLPSLYCCIWKPSMDTVNIGLFPVFTAISGSLLWMPSTSVSSQSLLLFLEAFYGCRQHQSLPSLHCCFWKPSMDAVNISLFSVFTAVSGSLLWMPSTSVSSQSSLLYLEALLWMPSTTVSSQSSLLFLEALLWMPSTSVSSQSSLLFLEAFYGYRQHRSLPSLYCCFWKPSMDAVNIGLFPVFTAVSGSLLWMPSTSVSSQSSLLFLEAFYGCHQHRSLPSLHCCFWKPFYGCRQHQSLPSLHCCIWKPFYGCRQHQSLPSLYCCFWKPFYGCRQHQSLPSLHCCFWKPFYGCRQHRSLPSLHCYIWKPSMDASTSVSSQSLLLFLEALLWMPSTSVSSQSSLLYLEAFYGCVNIGLFPVFTAVSGSPSMDAVNIGLFPVFTAISGSLLWMPSTSVSSQSSLLYLEAFYGYRQHRSLPCLHCCIWKPFYGGELYRHLCLTRNLLWRRAVQAHLLTW